MGRSLLVGVERWPGRDPGHAYMLLRFFKMKISGKSGQYRDAHDRKRACEPKVT
jgi:hypothetical protein